MVPKTGKRKHLYRIPTPRQPHPSHIQRNAQHPYKNTHKSNNKQHPWTVFVVLFVQRIEKTTASETLVVVGYLFVFFFFCNCAMKKAEDVTSSLRGLGSVLYSSYNFARKSPTLAKDSLFTAAAYIHSTGSYLHSKTTQSTLFVIGCWLAMLDLLQCVHVETLVTSTVAILDNAIQVLRSEECKVMLTSIINIASSEAVSNILRHLGQCLQACMLMNHTYIEYLP